MRLPVTHRLARRSGPRLLLVAELVVVGLVVTAASAPAETSHVLAQAQDINTVLTNARNWLMGILALLATVFLTIGGVRYVMANGDPGEIEKAKQSFKSAGLGYALAALAPLIVTILRGIVGA
ncbi:pilin [Saccharopolyspora sp. K220]|uniref:pilin n=1 Tax=Saccharopolyspora soli TaxID=2926618 RepID=UPI001F597772|nr:pilin [Saccharopolyspora soli]MCI2420053.1 pilin [Saccharopolyspora soli]